MGIDAVMCVGSSTVLSELTVKKLAFRLAEAFHAETFYNDRDGKRRALNILGDDDCLYPRPSQKEHKQLLRVSLMGRYYGKNYERGNLPQLLAIAKWLRYNISDAVVYYGGDTGNELEELTTEQEEILWNHFAKVGHLPYTLSFDTEKDGPICDLCEEQMVRCGWGPNYAAWHCGGCGKRIVRKDGVARELARGEDSF